MQGLIDSRMSSDEWHVTLIKVRLPWPGDIPPKKVTPEYFFKKKPAEKQGWRRVQLPR